MSIKSIKVRFIFCKYKIEITALRHEICKMWSESKVDLFSTGNDYFSTGILYLVKVRMAWIFLDTDCFYSEHHITLNTDYFFLESHITVFVNVIRKLSEGLFAFAGWCVSCEMHKWSYAPLYDSLISTYLTWNNVRIWWV